MRFILLALLLSGCSMPVTVDPVQAEADVAAAMAVAMACGGANPAPAPLPDDPGIDFTPAKIEPPKPTPVKPAAKATTKAAAIPQANCVNGQCYAPTPTRVIRRR